MMNMEFELLRCDVGSHRDAAAAADGGLTVKGVWSHLRSKLERSWENAQRIVPSADNASREGAEFAAKTGSTLDAASSAGSDAGIGWQALAVVTAPVSHLFGMLGGMPGWFSDAVFEVNQKGGSAYNDLSQRLVLVENRPRLLELACSLVAPPLHPQPPAAPATAAAAAGMPAFVPGLVRKLCSSDAPFPGKVVSRPCRVATEAKASAQQPSGWVSTMAQAWVSSAAGGGDAISAIIGGGGGGVCECAGRGPCTIRASPGREPCLHVEVGDVSKRGGRSGGGGGGGGFSAESVESTSAVRLRTYSLATTAAGAASPRASSADGRESAAATAVSDALVALHASAVRLGLPPSVAVPVYAAMLLTGVALLLVAQPLSESRAFHYLLSALLGGVVGAAAAVLRAVKNPRRSLLRFLMLGGVVTWLVVAAGVDHIPSPAELLSNLPGVMLAFWKMGLSSFPWAGKAFFAASGLAGVLTTWRQGLFLEEADEARGTWFNGQACIRRVLTFSGVFLVYNGVSDTDVGMALVVLALMAPTLAHYARRYNMWCNSSRWYRAGNQLSQEEYEAQGDAYTREAIAALRESTCNDWSLTKKGRGEGPGV
ncbi:hypothetical protein Esi_0064_0088 [Ectocarpus siliculosus]|uniref:Transmembrane protein n=1 Tax=Ectocarpus siliculosus TaxID=2880 RepID=D8LRC3_ECTSI|nr:hypothetical protein Esi_0064_0088 [Ectocarpus siliculosus]|eukprot:CBN75028.1 hypothetical protein Esi_0064_0088 [Ectocarpus siliculosus]